MKTLKIVIILVTFIPMLVIFLAMMPIAIIGVLAKGVMEWIERQLSSYNDEINRIAKSK